METNGTKQDLENISMIESWQSLKRYSHLRQAGDKYADWKWKEQS